MIEIAGRQVGPGQKCLIVAEAGVNHNGRIDLAMRLIDAAKAAGADAVKMQAFSVERICRRDSPMFRTLAPLELSHGQFRALKAHADDIGITFLCTPDDEQDADFLDQLGVPAFKIGSGNLRNLPFLRHVAAKGKPIILSTGMGSLEDVRLAVNEIAAATYGGEKLILLYCASVYPPADYDGSYEWWDPATVNLRAMDTLRQFGYPVGFSDHSPTQAISIAAVARDACLIERHMSLAETTGPDRYISLHHYDFGGLVARIREVEAALGDGAKRPTAAEMVTQRGIEGWRL